MSDLVELKNGIVTVSSKKICDIFGKAHRNIIRDIRSLDCSEEFRALNFEPSSYTSPQNKIFDCFDITRDGFAFLCMGFTGKKAAKWKEAYICAFNQMESYIQTDSDSLYEKINKVSLEIDDIKIDGSSWGKTGVSIRNRKKIAIEEITRLIAHAQLQLEF